jgi:hypothetical protein
MKTTTSCALVAVLLGFPAVATEAPTNYPVISVWPPSLFFGPVLMGESVTNSFAVKNVGGGRLDGWAGWGTHHNRESFEILDGAYSLAAGESHAVRVAYSPSGATSDFEDISFGNRDGTRATALVCGTRFGTNVAATPVISVGPTNIDFGAVKFGETRTNHITVKNIGGALLRGSAHVGLELTREEMRIAETNALKRRFTPAPFDLVSGNTYTLGSNESQTVVVTYTPSGLLPTNRALVYFPGEGRRVETRTVTLSGAIEVP